jgi:RND family efflux transporter MFP subunit
MNYATTITAEAAEPLGSELDGATRNRTRGVPRAVIWGGLGLLGLLLAIGAYFALAGGNPAPTADDESQAPVVTVVAPGQTTLEGMIEAPGQIAARRPMPVGVEGQGGRVVSVPVDAGEWVNAGQVLVVIDRAVQVQQVAAQAAQIDVARADAKLAQANLDRALKLVDRGFISTADVDRLTAERDSANARVKVAQAQLAELRARTAQLNVTAPASGYVLARNVEPGQNVGPGTAALFTIAQGGQMEMLAQVSEGQLSQLARGVNADVVIAGSNKSFDGQVWQLSPTVDERTRQGTVRIALPFAPELRPGGFATARIQGGTLTATVLPESAVLADEQGSFVYVVDEDNKAQRRAVTTGIVTDKGIAITEGLSGRELVVLRAGGFLNPGETVNPRRQKA